MNSLRPEYFFFRNKIRKSGDAILSHQNRAFRYGDAFFETMHFARNEVQFFKYHFERILWSMNLLKMESPEGFSANRLLSEIKRVVNANKFFKGSRVRITFFRDGAGLYCPEKNTADYIVEAKPLDSEEYQISAKGNIMGVYDEHMKSSGILSNLKSTNVLPLVLASIYCKEIAVDDVIIMNEKKEIIEGVSSNLFIVKNGEIKTPPLSSGCVAGIMRRVVLDICRSKGYQFSETSIFVSDLNDADEIFLTNAISGIKWIMGFGEKRFYQSLTKKLIKDINEIAFTAN